MKSLSLILNSNILLTVVTEHGLQQLGLNKNVWYQYAADMQTNPGQLNCLTCNTRTTWPVLSKVSCSLNSLLVDEVHNCI